MALNKRVKIGGISYKGYSLVVNSAPGAYVLNSSWSDNAAINSVSITPDKYGATDNYKLEHIISGTVNQTICSTIYNLGSGVTMNFDFAAMQNILAGQTLRLTYNNVASTAMNVYMHVERIGARG